jgi:hypothetical protein
MSTERIPPTAAQRRLVNIGMFIQFHLAALGHLVVWLGVIYETYIKPHAEDWEGRVIGEVIIFLGYQFRLLS